MNVSVTSPERASSTTSAWSIVSAIQSLPAWNVIAAVLAPPRWMVCVTRSVPGSILVIAPPSVLATQIAPPPWVMAPGCPLTGMRSITLREPGSTRSTSWSFGAVIQSEPALLVIAAGAFGS